MRTRFKRAQTIDLCVDATRSLGWGLLKQTALPSLYCVAVFFFAQNLVLNDIFTTKVGASLQAQVTEVLVRLAILLFVALPLLVIGTSYLFGVATVMVGDWVGGLIPDSEAAGRRTLQVLGKIVSIVARQAAKVSIAFLISALFLIASTVNQELALTTTGIAILGFVVAFLYLAYQWVVHALVVSVAIVEGGSARDIAKRSRTLLSTSAMGNSGQNEVMKLLFTVFFVELAMSVGVDTLYSTLGVEGWMRQLFGTGFFTQLLTGAGEFFLTFCVFWIAISFGAVGRAVLYYDRRIRLEGFDVELMARAAWRADKRARFEL